MIFSCNSLHYFFELTLFPSKNKLFFRANLLTMMKSDEVVETFKICCNFFLLIKIGYPNLHLLQIKKWQYLLSCSCTCICYFMDNFFAVIQHQWKKEYIAIISTKNRIKFANNPFITAFVNIKCKVYPITSISICAIVSWQYVISCNIMLLLSSKMLFLQYYALCFGWSKNW